MEMNRTVLGKWGEACAAEYLRKKKYRILGANYHTRFGEIDLIAERRNVLIFVEVKLRKDAAFAEAREFVTQSKQRKLRTSAELWLAAHPTEKPVRFDVIEIYAPQGAQGPVTIEHLENAFA